ncbi:hypothetical protein KL938_002554 [Ogataea parapolymorpha]|nr:hypothetical protein KL938_002554 [Ogataea parapolymorpha]
MHFIEEVVRQKATTHTESTPSSATRAPNKRKRINYNIAALQNAIEQQNFDQDGDEENEESERHNAIELKKANRRFEELDRENFSEIHKMEIPKNLGPPPGKRTSTPSVAVKRILNSKKNWSNYVDELDKAEMRAFNGLEIKPGHVMVKKLCTICGNVSYSSCIRCGARVCSLKCQTTHSETRCSGF